MNRAITRLAIAGIAGAAFVSTSCSSGTTGSPQPASTTHQTTSSPSTSTPENASENEALAALEPCDLLTSTEAGQLGLEYPGKGDEIGGANTCLWKQSGNGSAAAGIRADQGIDDLDYTDDLTIPTKIGNYQATRIEAPLGAKYMCHVVISVTDSSTVQVIGTVVANSTDTAAACTRATQAAELIAPKLP